MPACPPAVAKSRPPPDATGARHPASGAGPAWQPTEILPRPGTAHPRALPAGAHVAGFEVLRVPGEGGFGIVDLARDHALQRQVAVKESMPVALALGTAGDQVMVGSHRQQAAVNTGLHSFIDEARRLARFDHPSLLKVHRVWRANGTACMAMPYHAGRTLQQHLRAAATPPDEAWLRALLASLPEALAVAAVLFWTGRPSSRTRVEATAVAPALAQAHAGQGSVVAGRARCSGAGCDRDGAAGFGVDVVR